VGSTNVGHDDGAKGPAFVRAVALGVEVGGHLGIGVVVQEAVNGGNRGRIGVAHDRSGQGQGDLERLLGAALEADVQGDGVGSLEQRDVFDEQAEHPLALPIKRAGVLPQPREVHGQSEDCGAFLFGEHVGGVALALCDLLGSSERTQFGVPVRLQHVGDQAIVGIDAQKPALGQVGLVARPLYLLLAQAVSLLSAGDHFGLHGECHLQGLRRDGAHEQSADRGIDWTAGDELAGTPALLNSLVLADIVGHQAPPPLVIVDAQALSAAATQGHTLQERRALSRRAGWPILAVGLGVLPQTPLILLVRFPGDVPHVRAGKESKPLLPRHVCDLQPPLDPPGARPPEGKGTRIARVVEKEEHGAVLEWPPEHLTPMRARLHPMGEAQALRAEAAHGGAGRTSAAKRLKDQPYGLLGLLVRIEDDLVVLAILQADGQGHLERPTARLVEDAPTQACPQHVEFCLAHRAFETQQQAIVEGGRVVDPVLVQDEGARQAADLQQAVPVAVVAGEARDLQPQHDAHMAQANLRDE